MLALKPFAEAHGRSMVQGYGGPVPPVSFLALHGFPTHQLAYMLDSLVRVSRRADWKPSASVLTVQLLLGGRSTVQHLGQGHSIGRVSTPAVIPQPQPTLTST